MIYVPEDYDNYRYLVSFGDNYVVLTNRRSVSASYTEPVSISTFTQFLYPSTYSFSGSTSITSNRTFTEIDVGSSFYDRADCPLIFLCIFVALFFSIFILNGLTRFVRKGGLFFGS